MTASEENLRKTKSGFGDRIDKIRKRAIAVQREQEKLCKNLGKYNNFVKEKTAKVEEGERQCQEEIRAQETIEAAGNEKRRQVQDLKEAKVVNNCCNCG